MWHPAPPVGNLGLEGFEAFATPRSFDGPGTIYRLDKDGKRFLVASLDVVNAVRGKEVIPKFTSSRDLSISQLLESIGVAAAKLPANANINMTSSRKTSLETTNGDRKEIADGDILTVLNKWKASTKPIEDNKYYLIRATIASDNVDYKVDKSWLFYAKLDLSILNLAGYKGSANSKSEDTLELESRFDEKMNIWFKAERIFFDKALGIGGDQTVIRLAPAQKGELGL
jgi:hypothetical protein